MGSLLSLLFALAGLLNPHLADPPWDALRVSWESSIGERIDSLPNPYDEPRPIRLSLLDESRDPEMPPLTLLGDRRWFEMEDSADWLGLALGSWATAGLQVEFAGPAEETKRERRMIHMRRDPFDPIYVQTTAGIRIRF
jgi:hypothetical protein